MPELRLIETPPDAELNDQADAFWGVIAHAAEDAITDVHAAHPDRREFCSFLAFVRRAAGLPPLRDESPPEPQLSAYRC